MVDNLRAYLQIVDVASILGLEHDISDHAFQLFRDCSSATFLRNRSVEALATACLVQAIREAQEPRTLQEISIAANLPQKEIGKYIKILGEALQLSQPINSNSIAVHMPRFCNLLQLNKSAQELATHIGEVVMNKCFCTRRNPISISAAAIYLACQLEDRRKTQAEICKVTGLTEVTLRKVYKELLENWDDLLPSNYTPVVPPEKAFPTTTIASGRSTGPRAELPETAVTDREKQPESKTHRTNQVVEMNHQDRGKGESEGKGSVPNASKTPTSWKSGTPFGTNAAKTSRENQNANHGIGLTKSSPMTQEMEHKVPGSVAYHDRGKGETESKASIPASKAPTSWKTGVPCGTDSVKTSGESQILNQGIGLNKSSPSTQELEQKAAGAMTHPDRGRGEPQARSSAPFTHKATTSWRPGLPFTPTSFNPSGVIPSPNPNQGISVNLKKSSPGTQEAEQKVFGSMRSNPFVAAKVFGASSTVGPPLTSSPLPHVQSSQPGQYQTTSASSEVKGTGKYNEGKGSDPDRTR